MYIFLLKGGYILSSRTEYTQDLRQGLQATSSSLRLDSPLGVIWPVMLSALLAGLAGADQVLPAPQSRTRSISARDAPSAALKVADLVMRVLRSRRVLLRTTARAILLRTIPHISL